MEWRFGATIAKCIEFQAQSPIRQVLRVFAKCSAYSPSAPRFAVTLTAIVCQHVALPSSAAEQDRDRHAENGADTDEPSSSTRRHATSWRVWPISLAR
jgi:hypothetical protein